MKHRTIALKQEIDPEEIDSEAFENLEEESEDEGSE